MAPLAQLTTLRLGGPARRLVAADGEAELVDAVRATAAAGEPLVVLAGGSNVVVADEGFPGTVVHVCSRGITVARDGDRLVLTLQAGEPWDDVVARLVADGVAGVECLSGIPGSAGATPIQNVGAYGQEISTSVRSVRVYDRHCDEVHDLAGPACGFGYRTSVFKRTPQRWVVLAVELAFALDRRALPVGYPELARKLGVAVGTPVAPGEVRAAVLELRRRKGMAIDPGDPDSVSAGSFFLNPLLERAELERLRERAHELLGPDADPPAFAQTDGRVKTSAAWLVERAGFSRGYARPGARIAISSKHVLALVNRGGGTSAELVELAREIATGVASRFGVELRPEPVFIGHAWPGLELELTTSGADR